MRITILRSLCVDVCGRKLGSLLLLCFTENPQDEAEITAQSKVGGCFGGRACVYSFILLLSVCGAYVCAGAQLFFQNIHPVS